MGRPPRILVVEDEWLLASDMQRRLEREGFDVVGPAATVGRAMQLVDENRLDAAILGVRLDGETTFALARRLDSVGIPLMFLTGHNPADFAELSAGHVLLPKPADWRAVTATLRELLPKE